VRGFTATMKIGINAHDKKEAENKAKDLIKTLDLPIWLVDVE